MPLKMQSDMRSARSILWLCSPSTQEIASTTFDFPQPLGPTMQVMPVPLNVIGVFSQNDLNPNKLDFTQFQHQFPRTVRSLSFQAEEASIYRSFVGGISRQKLWRVDSMALPPGAYRDGGYGNKK